jgi:hypothetical protein
VSAVSRCDVVHGREGVAFSAAAALGASMSLMAFFTLASMMTRVRVVVVLEPGRMQRDVEGCHRTCASSSAGDGRARRLSITHVRSLQMQLPGGRPHGRNVAEFQ